MDEKRTQMKQTISQAQNLEYPYNCQIRIENTLKFPKLLKILSEYNRTDITGEILRKIQSGSDPYFETPVFLRIFLRSMRHGLS